MEEAAKESPKAAKLTQQSSEDNEVFGELLGQLEMEFDLLDQKKEFS